MGTVDETRREQLREILRRGLYEEHPRTTTEIRSTIRGWIEQGVPANPQRKTLAKADQLMGWEPGSAWRFLHDEAEPQVNEEPIEDIMPELMAISDSMDRLANAFRSALTKHRSGR